VRGGAGPLRHRAFRLLLAGRTVNALGNSVAPIALAFAVLDLTGSARDLGLVVGARSLANVAFLLFGGVIADRLPRSLVLVGASVAAFVTQAAVAVLVLTGIATIPLLIGLGLVNGVVAALALPATAAILPETVPAEIRQRANAYNRLGVNAGLIVGAPLGGILVAAVGPGWGIAVDAVAFLLAGLFFALLRLPARTTEPGPRAGVPADLRTGWAEFRSRTWLWAVVAGFCLLNAVWTGGMFVLGPLVADDTIGRSAWGVVLAAQTAGLVVGAVVAMRLRLRRLLLVGVVCCLGMSLPLFALGLFPTVPVLVLAGFVAGMMLEQFGIAWETTMQEHIPSEKLARVYSYDMVGSFLAVPVGQMAIGPIAEAVGLEVTLIGTGVLVVVAVLGMLSSSEVRNLGHRLPSGAMKESVP
jgi:MFS family permease